MTGPLWSGRAWVPSRQKEPPRPAAVLCSSPAPSAPKWNCGSDVLAVLAAGYL